MDMGLIAVASIGVALLVAVAAAAGDLAARLFLEATEQARGRGRS